MANAVYILCALTSLVCTVLLVRSWRANRTHLLLWSSVCFGGLLINNILLVADANISNDVVDLSVPRAATALASILALLAGLIWNAK